MKSSSVLLLGALVAAPAIGQVPPPRIAARHPAPRTSAPPQMSYLDNGTIRVGVDLDMGGAITYLSRSSDSVNVINSFDLGREVNPSFYSGPSPYGHPSPDWPNWPWNPVGAGDTYGNRSQVVSSANDGSTLFVRAIPMQWALDNVACECFVETRITLDGNAVRLRYRLTNHRTDLRDFGGYGQELPAVYTVGKLWRLFTYDGASPFTGDSVREVPFVAGPPWQALVPTENWVALVDDSKWGVGVVNTDVFFFLGGFAGTPDAGGPGDNNTGYIAPVREEMLDHNIAYTYEASLVLGTVADIRAYAVAHRRADSRPDYHFDLDRFQEDRRGFTYLNAMDEGLPIRGSLHVKLDEVDPQIYPPEGHWDASEMPVLYIRAAFHTHDATGAVFWSGPGQDIDGSRVVLFPTIPDGQFHTYAVDLAASPDYTGTIAHLRFDPGDGGVADDWVEIAWISFQPDAAPRRPRVVERH